MSDIDAIVQLSFAVQGVLGELAAEHHLSLTQLRVLAILRDREPTMLDLARHLKLEKSSVTGLIDRAAKRGLVERVAAAHDGRAIHVRLTPAGRELAAAGAARAEASIEALLEPLSARDRARLSALAEAVVLHHRGGV
jgi:MarR family transcriptional regulator, lower aerobic nicotinate degradation pathway regulator